jgi:NAD(P)-dependent dehydrogenase (short-subunit alcohol dehydrogenase family)
LRDPIRTWRDQGVDVVIVGNGNRKFAEAFREEFEIEGRLLVDPDLHAYRAAGLRRGRREMMSPRILGNAFRALRSGARQTAVEGDPWQLGGVFVIAPGGELRFEHRSVAMGDHASPDEIEAALDEVADGIDEPGSTASPFALAMNALRPALDASPFFSFDRLGFQRHAVGYDPTDLEVDLYGRRYLVTGGSTGLGYETALALADLGAEVLLLDADRDPLQEAVKTIRQATGNRRVEAVDLDVSDFGSIDRVIESLVGDPIDGLVHAADVLCDERSETRDGLELAFATHVVGPHRLTKGLVPALEAADDARVVWVSSGAMLTRRLNMADPNWLDRDYDGLVAWAETKRAQVILAKLWAEAFEGSSVRVNAMHPGWTDTAPVRKAWTFLHRLAKPILRTPAEGADTIVWLAASPALDGRSGKFFFDRQVTRTHWLPTTREEPDDRDTLWRSCDES